MSQAVARPLLDAPGLAVRGADSERTASAAPALLRGIATNVFTILVGGLGAFFTLLIARLLGEAALGGYLLAWATADLASKVGTLGLDQGTTALVARRRAEGDAAGTRAVFRIALLAGLGSSAVVAGVGWLVLGWLRAAHETPDLVTAQRTMLLALPAVALYRIANGASRGLGIMGHDALSGGLLQSVAKIAALVAFVWFGLPAVVGAIDTAVLAAMVGFAAAAGAAWLLARGALRRGAAEPASPVPSQANAPALLPLSVLAAATGLVNLAMQRLDLLVLGAFVGRAPGLDLATLGVYGAAAELAGLTRKVRFAAEAPFLHALATAQGRGRGDEERSVFGDVARWMLPASLFVAAGLAIGSPLWLSLFGPGFERGTMLLCLLVVAHSISSHSGLAENVLLLRRPALNLVNATLGVATYFVLCLALVPRLGAMGAAIASVGAYGAVAALRFGELRAMGVHWPWKRLRGAWSAFLVALVPALVLREVLPGRAGAALAVFAFFSVFVWAVVRWAFDEGDREAFFAIVPSLARPWPRPVPPVVQEAKRLTAILVVSSENDGGAARSTFLLARDLRRFGVRPIVALHREGDLSRRLAAAGLAFEVVPGLPEDLTRRPGRPDSLWAVPGNVGALPRAVSYLRDLAAREGASVLYGQGTWANILSAFAARGSGVGAVWHIRNDFRPPLKRLVMRAVARACGVRAIVAVSRSAAAPLEELKVPLHVVHNGADLAASDAARSAPLDLRRRLGIPESAVVACYAGRLLPHKGIHVLMEAARRAMSREASLHLVILGGNPAHAARDVRGELSQQAAVVGPRRPDPPAGMGAGRGARARRPRLRRDPLHLPRVLLTLAHRVAVPRAAGRGVARRGKPGAAAALRRRAARGPGRSRAAGPGARGSRERGSAAPPPGDRGLRGALPLRLGLGGAARGGRPEEGSQRRRSGREGEGARAAPCRTMRAAAGGVLVLALVGVQCSDPPREWSIGLYRGESPLDLVPAGPNPVLTAADLGIDATFVADPFLLRRDGRLFLFFEAWRRGSGQGDLCWAERDAAGAWRYSGVALDEPFHLSYPFVFEHEGEVFMIPESRSQRDVRLYAARPFPGRFELRRVLLSGERYADTSLVRWQGRFYLFTSTDNGTLELFHASALEGPYHPHPRSPVISGDDCAARPGGRPIVWQGRVLRFAQCDRPVYGVSVRAFEVTELSPSGYAERPAGRDPLLTGSGVGWNAGGMHHLDPLVDARGVLAAVDGWRPVD